MDKQVTCRAKALLLLAFFVIAGSSCMNEDYELSEENLNLEVTPFKGGLTLPLGKTDRITLQNLLKDVDTEFLSVGEDGSYSIAYVGAFDAGEELSEISGMMQIPGFEYSQTIGFKFNSSLARAVGNLTAPVGHDFEVGLLSQQDVPESVVSLGLVEFESTYLDIRFSASDFSLPQGVRLSFNLNLKMPDMMKVEGADANGLLKLNGELDGNNSLEYKIKLNAIDFTGVNLNENVLMRVNLSGTLGLSVASADASQWAGRNFGLDFSVSMPENTTVSRITCKLNHSLDPIYKTIDLTDFQSFFDDLGSDVNLDFKHVDMTLGIGTNLGTPAEADLELIPYYEGRADETGTIKARIALNTSASADRDAITNYVFDEAAVLELLNEIPERLDMKATVRTNSQKECVIEPMADYHLNADYNFELPLEFGDNFAITYKDTITDLPEILGSILASGNKVKLAGEMENSLPLGLDLKLNLLDSEDNVIPSPEDSGKQAIAPCDADGNASKTDVDLLLAVREGVKAEDIAAVELVFTANSKGVSGVQAAQDDFLQGTFQIVLPEGATIDLNDMVFGDEQ